MQLSGRRCLSILSALEAGRLRPSASKASATELAIVNLPTGWMEPEGSHLGGFGLKRTYKMLNRGSSHGEQLCGGLNAAAASEVFRQGLPAPAGRLLEFPPRFLDLVAAGPNLIGIPGSEAPILP